MERTLELELIERCLALIQARKPAGEAEVEAPLDRYLDPQRFRREMEMFRRHPLLVAHASDLAEVGDFLRADLFGTPALVVRTTEGVQGFINVCRHRGATVEPRPCGRANRLVCPYHGWTYDLAGGLKQVPFPEGFDRRPTGLKALQTQVLGGFIFVTPLGEAPLPDGLGEIASFGSETVRTFARTVKRWKANWKLILEGGLESYHFFRAHSETVGRLFPSNVSLVDRIGTSFRSVLPRHHMRALLDVDRAQWSLRPNANLLYSLFPSTSVLVNPDHLVRITSTPLSVFETSIEVVTLVPPNAEKDEYWEKNHALTIATLDEDFHLAEQIQNGLGSGANDHFRFGRYEHALPIAHEIIEAKLG